jgi:hypothetical protein
MFKTLHEAGDILTPVASISSAQGPPQHRIRLIQSIDADLRLWCLATKLQFCRKRAENVMYFIFFDLRYNSSVPDQSRAGKRAAEATAGTLGGRRSRGPAGGAVPAGPAERTPFRQRDLRSLCGLDDLASSWLRAARPAIGIKMLRCRTNAFTPRVLGRNLAPPWTMVMAAVMAAGHSPTRSPSRTQTHTAIAG